MTLTNEEPNDAGSVGGADPRRIDKDDDPDGTEFVGSDFGPSRRNSFPSVVGIPGPKPATTDER